MNNKIRCEPNADTPREPSSLIVDDDFINPQHTHRVINFNRLDNKIKSTLIPYE